MWKIRAGWLAGIATLILLCLAAVPRPQAKTGFVDNHAPQLEGSWLVTVTLDLANGPPPFETLVSYTADGVALCSDPSVYPLFPMQTAYHGAWAKRRGPEFAFTMIGFQYDEAISGLWKAIIKESLTMERGGDAYHGKGTVEWYDPNGGSGGVVETSTYAVRIEAE